MYIITVYVTACPKTEIHILLTKKKSRCTVNSAPEIPVYAVYFMQLTLKPMTLFSIFEH